MQFEAKISIFSTIFQCRIYGIFLAVVFLCALPILLLAQEINSFRTVNSGNYSNPGTWEVYDGTSWFAATTVPNQTNDIYIDQTHTLTLNANQAVKSIFINAETGAGQKLNLNGFSLEVYGSLAAFSGPAPGSPSGTWNSQNWIGNSLGSQLIFKGNTRTIIERNAWSGFSTQSRYSIIFDPGVGQSLTIEEPVKSLSFTIRSGTVIQDVDSSVNPGVCATFSFNNEGLFGANEFGTFTIEAGASLISRCNDQIIFRSNSRSASLFDLQDGAELVLEGDSPEMDVVNYQLDGKVLFANGSTQKSYITRSMGSSSIPLEVNDLELSSTVDLQLPNNLSISGDLIQSNTGQFIANSSTLTFTGNQDQQVLGFPLIAFNLTLDKSNREVSFARNLTVLSELQMISGGMSLLGNNLSLNLLGSGGMNYQDGYWREMELFTYNFLPPTFTAQNGTFPFLDSYQGGIRKVQFLGNTPGGNLSISFTEFDGAEFNANFNDLDGTPILYRLFSYFQFSDFTPDPNPLEFRISAAQLIVDDPDDLRLVGTGYPAPGSHLGGLDPTELWARRSLSFTDLTGLNFTVGSFRTLSVLPVTWLEVNAERTNGSIELSWLVASEENNKRFEIYRSNSLAKDWEKIGEIESLRDTMEERGYAFTDNSPPKYKDVYYRIKQIDYSGNYSWSPVTLARREHASKIKIYPNPHEKGAVTIALPLGRKTDFDQVEIIGLTSPFSEKLPFEKRTIEAYLGQLPPGVYLILLESPLHLERLRWIKK